MVLYTACLHYGVPQHLISDKGGAYISDEFEAVCVRLGINHQKITSTEGESYLNLMEIHFNIQRCLYDYQFSLSRTPLDTACFPERLSTLKEAEEELIEALITEVMRRADGNQGVAARLLGISRQVLNKRLRHRPPSRLSAEPAE